MRSFLAPLFALTLGLALPALGQTHTLTIQNGEVRVDGRLQQPDEIPPSLDIDGVTVQLSFTGADAASFQLGGRVYAIMNGRILESPTSDEAESRTTVVFRGTPAPPSARAAAEADAAYGESVGSANAMMQHYVMEVQREDVALYNRLVKEIDLENQTLEHAQHIRSMPAGPARDAEIAELRKLLEQIFELKQENRKMEVEQLEKQLSELQRRFEEREELKKQIIEQRLRELIE